MDAVMGIIKPMIVVGLLSGLTACSTLVNTSVLSSAAIAKIQNVSLGQTGNLTRPQLAARLAGPAAGTPPAVAAAAAQNELDDAYNRMTDYCHATLARFEGRADKLAFWSAAIAVVGSLAGGVAVPALAVKGVNKAWTAALGGISGAANAGQQSLNGAGLNAAAQLQSRQDILTSWKADIAPYRGGSVFSDTRISGRTAVHSPCGRSRSDAKTETKPCPRVQGPGSA